MKEQTEVELGALQEQFSFTLVYDAADIEPHEYQDGREVLDMQDDILLDEIIENFHKLSDEQLVSSVVVDHLNKLRIKYPHHPIIIDLLTSYYAKCDNDEMFQQFVAIMETEYPRYFLGRIKRASNLLRAHEYAQAFDALGRVMTLQQACPGRTIFHIYEVVRFYGFLVNYHVAMINRLQAQRFYNILKSYVSKGGADRDCDDVVKEARLSLEKLSFRELITSIKGAEILQKLHDI